MASTIQITFDAADPDKLATFWAEAIGYKEQDPPDGFDSWDDWLDANGLQAQRGQAAAIVDPEGVGPRFYFQKVPERKIAKNRLHLDITAADRSLGPEDRVGPLEAEARRLVAHGAARVELIQRPGEVWIVMQDPEGNEFCLH